MKESDQRVEVLLAEIDSDLQAMENVEGRIVSLYGNLKKGESASDRDKAALGYYLHNLYNAVESMLKRIAGFFENSLEGIIWHSDLLKRMTLKIEEIRPPVISEVTYTLLNELRKFRHIFRHSYDYELRWERMDALWKEYQKNKKHLWKDIGEIKKAIGRLK
jgi:hypothetical protein